jgi:hypothetical protein
MTRSIHGVIDKGSDSGRYTSIFVAGCSFEQQLSSMKLDSTIESKVTL